MEPALLAVIQALHQAFIESHLREHQQADQSQKELEEERAATSKEQNARYTERFSAQEKAVEVAATSSRAALEAALAGTKEAITKSEIAQEKKSDATYVSIVKLQEAMAQVMPRAEAENRFRSADAGVAELRDRVKALEASRVGQAVGRVEVLPWILAVIALVGVAVTLIVAFGGGTPP